MKKYNFDEIIDRNGTSCIKYDARSRFFGKEDILPLWVADTDFRTPDFIMDAIRNRANHEILGYSFRSESYHQSIIHWLKKKHNWDINEEWISFSPGVVAGLTIAIEALTEPGDGIILQPPVYFPFFDSIKGTGRKLIENPLKLIEGRYYFDIQDLKKKITKNTKILLLCNPQNPGGMAWNKQELKELADVCLQNNIVIVSDEIHSDLIFDGYKHTPLASLSKEIANSTITCMAPSKTFNIAGLSTSFVIISNKRIKAKYERKLHTPHLHMGNLFGNVALEAAYNYGEDWLKELMEYIQLNFDFLETFFHERLPKVKIMKPEATYLIWLDFSAYMLDDKALNKKIIDAGVGLNPGIQFGKQGKGFMRINIGCPKSVLEEALIRIEKAFG